MTKKDYEMIAFELKSQHALLKFYRDEKDYKWSCKLWAATLGAENPRFDKEKFLTACGIETN